MLARPTLMARLRRPARPGLAAALVLLMMWAQWAGLAHRLEHAGRLHGPVQAELPRHLSHQGEVRAEGPASPAESYHSCVLFDGLHLADALPSVLPALPAFVHERTAPRATRFASWQAACAPPFLSRGPPQA